jgi:hypothetical protein
MKKEKIRVSINKLRLHIKSDPKLAKRFANAIDDACKQAKLKLPSEFFEGLVIVHLSELDSPFAVPVLPVGSQCGL